MSEAESLQLERTPYHAEEGFCGFDRYLVGAWKRTLQWREFGGSFAHLRTSNTIVVIDEHISKDAQTHCLKWSFGRSLDPTQQLFGFVMRISEMGGGDAELEWQYKGTACHGRYHALTGLSVLTFCLRSSTVILHYRIVDADSQLY
eukprot:TRINITY_DN10171_c0_g1_i2.p1 TRINITY_DN10171_c0_g1~~TRINITY_DN10171_c0_g1_i2.p1  ORF type:complete len:146 (+),score=23.46 TRINITY_DN10171_c0_g1_i2:111-548(+)